MTRRCFLHVGCPKTGTTYLQNVLWSSRPALEKQGVRLPMHRPRDHFWMTLVLRDRLDPALDSPAAYGVLDRLEAALSEAGDDDLLVSHELLAPVRPHGIARLMQMLDDFEVHVVITARDLYRQVPAEWQQHVKTRSVKTFQEFLTWLREEPAAHFWLAQDVADIAQRWSAGLPSQRVHIVTVPPAGAPPVLLLERFCSVLGVEPWTLESDVSRTNPSLGAGQVELLRRVNVALGDRLPHPRAGYNKVAKQWFAEEVLAQQRGGRLSLSASELDWVEQRSRTMVGRIAEAGYEIVGDLDDLLPPRPSAPDRTPAPTDTALLEVAVEAFACVLEMRRAEVEEHRAQVSALRREVAGLRCELTAARQSPLHRLRDRVGGRRRG
jgi:hypothetical protein